MCIREIVFFTRENAEAKLKEMEEKDGEADSKEKIQ